MSFGKFKARYDVVMESEYVDPVGLQRGLEIMLKAILKPGRAAASEISRALRKVLTGKIQSSEIWDISSALSSVKSHMKEGTVNWTEE